MGFGNGLIPKNYRSDWRSHASVHLPLVEVDLVDTPFVEVNSALGRGGFGEFRPWSRWIWWIPPSAEVDLVDSPSVEVDLVGRGCGGFALSRGGFGWTWMWWIRPRWWIRED